MTKALGITGIWQKKRVQWLTEHFGIFFRIKKEFVSTNLFGIFLKFVDRLILKLEQNGKIPYCESINEDWRDYRQGMGRSYQP